MRKLSVLSAAVALCGASFAFGDTLVPDGQSTQVKTPSQAGNYNSGGPEAGIIVPFNVQGIPSVDGLTSPNNTVIIFNAATALGKPNGSPVFMNGIGWDVNLTAAGASWLSELAVYFDDNVAPDLTGLHLRPGAGVNNPGTQTFQDGPGVIKFGPGSPNPGIAEIFLPNGLLRMEFYESFDDGPGPDGTWNSGILELQFRNIPEPTSLAVLSLGGLALIRRRRA